jgi:NADP-dependent 3-hydroxy acid dehydrogenase YdfG
MTTWFITGASSGPGEALARAVLDQGHKALITARNTGHLRDIVDAHPTSAPAVPLDITNHDQVVVAVDAAVSATTDFANLQNDA